MQISGFGWKQWTGRIEKCIVCNEVIEYDRCDGFTVKLSVRKVSVNSRFALYIDGNEKDHVGDVQCPKIFERFRDNVVLVSQVFGQNNGVETGVVECIVRHFFVNRSEIFHINFLFLIVCLFACLFVCLLIIYFLTEMLRSHR